MSRIPEDELEFRFFRAGGPGGQNVNKVATALQMRFDVKNSPSLTEPVKARLMKLAGSRLTLDGIIQITAVRFRTQERNKADAIARLDDPQITHGEVWLDHQPLHLKNSHQASQLGIGLVPEDRRIIPGLTVEENLQLAQIAPPIGWSIERLYELFPRLGERRKQEGVTLSGGEQQMLAIARALARDIKVLLLDEPYEGLAPVIVDEIEKTLRLIKEQGITTVIVEQNAVRALELADRSVILDTGSVVFDGAAAEVLGNEELRAEYLAI